MKLIISDKINKKMSSHHINKEVKNRGDILHVSFGSEEETIGQNLKGELHTHANDEHVLSHLQHWSVHYAIDRRLEHH